MRQQSMKGKVFTAQQVQSMIAGNMTMFREVKVQPNSDRNRTPAGFNFTGIWGGGAKESRRECPYQVGQKIFCKESFAEIELSCSKGYYTGRRTIYRDEEHEVKWKPAQHMKQEHSRLTLLIKEIKVERLADISAGEALSEGISESEFWKPKDIDEPDDYRFWHTYPQQAFKNYWNATHKKPEEKFEANPWVWCVNFEVVK